jgi:hypothetical protein
MAVLEFQRPVVVPEMEPRAVRAPVTLACPLEVRVGRIAAFLNGELPDHAVYDGFELQWFDDETHGTGMLAFLSRREDRRVDYYVDPALRLDPSGYVLGAGTGAWVATDFDEARLAVTLDGVDAATRFVDVDGRAIEIRARDVDAGPGRRGVLLAPFGDGIDQPTSLALVYVHGFDLVRYAAEAPVVRIDGEVARTGRLPGAALHRRHLVKYGGPLTVATICPAVDGPLTGDLPADGTLTRAADGTGTVSVAARSAGAAADLVLDPAFPDLRDLEVGRLRTGSWHVDVDDTRITGGNWFALRRSTEEIELGLDVTERWTPPAGEPPLVAIVTRALPTFRRWPTTYRWRAELALGERPTIRSRWERTGAPTGGTYRRLTS